MSRHTRTKADVLKEFDAWTKRDADRGPHLAAIAKRSRRAIEMLSPTAPLYVVVLNESGDVADLYFDGTHMVRVPKDGMGAVEAYSRARK